MIVDALQKGGGGGADSVTQKILPREVIFTVVPSVLLLKGERRTHNSVRMLASEGGQTQK